MSRPARQLHAGWSRSARWRATLAVRDEENPDREGITTGPMWRRHMKNRRLASVVFAAAFLVLSSVGLAQETSAQEDVAARIVELRERVQRLAVLAELPAEARPEAEALLDGFDDLRLAEQELEVARLEALVASLENGDSASVARQVAESAVAQRSVELTRQREELNDQLEALGEAYPEVATLIRNLAIQRRLAGRHVLLSERLGSTVLPLLEGARAPTFRFDGPEGGPFGQQFGRDAFERWQEMLPRLRQVR